MWRRGRGWGGWRLRGLGLLVEGRYSSGVCCSEESERGI